MGKRKNAHIIIDQYGSCREPINIKCKKCGITCRDSDELKLKNAKQYLIDHPKKSEQDFVPGKIYKNKSSDTLVLCLEGEAIDEEHFYGLSIKGIYVGSFYCSKTWIKSCFDSTPVEIEVSK